MKPSASAIKPSSALAALEPICAGLAALAVLQFLVHLLCIEVAVAAFASEAARARRTLRFSALRLLFGLRLQLERLRPEDWQAES